MGGHTTNEGREAVGHGHESGRQGWTRAEPEARVAATANTAPRRGIRPPRRGIWLPGRAQGLRVAKCQCHPGATATSRSRRSLRVLSGRSAEMPVRLLTVALALAMALPRRLMRPGGGPVSPRPESASKKQIIPNYS